MRTSAYLICQKKHANDEEGYLMLLSKGREKKKKKALGLKVNVLLFKKYWNEKEQKFKSGMPLFKLLNEEIRIAFNEFEKTDSPVQTKNSSLFVEFWELKIAEIENHNSRIKTDNIKKKFVKFLNHSGRSDIRFSDLKPELIKDYQKYLKTAKDPKAVSPNTATHYLKVLKMYVERKLEDEPQAFTLNPFTGVKYSKREEIERVVLQDDQIDLLLNSEIIEPKIDLDRDKFLFQIFAQGLRVSDLLLLRWSNIDTGVKVPTNRNEYPRFLYFDEDNTSYICNIPGDILKPLIKYRMFKTNTYVDVPITYNLCVILVKLIGKEWLIYENYDSTYYRTELMPSFFKDCPKAITMAQIEDAINKHCISKSQIKDQKATEEYFGFYFEDEVEGLRDAIDFFVEEKNKIVDDFIQLSMYHITYYIWKLQCLNSFVFPHLKDRFFEGVDSSKGWKSKLSFAQNKKLLNGEHLYNRQLKKVAKYCGINTNVTSHVGRHSFVQLLLNAGAPTHSIMDALKHKNLATTDKYIRNKDFNKGETDYISKIGNREKYRKF